MGSKETRKGVSLDWPHSILHLSLFFSSRFICIWSVCLSVCMYVYKSQKKMCNILKQMLPVVVSHLTWSSGRVGSTEPFLLPRAMSFMSMVSCFIDVIWRTVSLHSES